MTCYRAKIMTFTKESGDAPGILYCKIPSTEYEVSPADTGLGDGIVPVIYTSPYSFHGDGGFIGFPPDGTWILVERINKFFYYLTSIVGPEPSDLEEVSEDTEESVADGFGCSKSYDPIYSSEGVPDTFMIKHPKGHSLIMRDDVPMDNEEVKPIHNVHNSKIEMKSAGAKVISLDDSNSVNAVRIGVDKQGRKNNEFDGIIIGHHTGLIGPRCIKTQAKNNITTKTDSGDIVNTVVDGSKYEVENTSTGNDGNILAPKPQINTGTTFGDINLVAGNNHLMGSPLKSKLGGSKIVIEALGTSRIANWVEEIPPPPMSPPGTPGKPQEMSAPVLPPLIRITSDGDIEIFAGALVNGPIPSGKIKIKAVGDINLESTLGNINIAALVGKVNIVGSLGVDIAGMTVNLNPPVPPIIPPMVSLPSSEYVGPSLRGYVPFGWMMPFSPPI